jgi:hypothetical protein
LPCSVLIQWRWPCAVLLGACLGAQTRANEAYPSGSNMRRCHWGRRWRGAGVLYQGETPASAVRNAPSGLSWTEQAWDLVAYSCASAVFSYFFSLPTLLRVQTCKLRRLGTYTCIKAHGVVSYEGYGKWTDLHGGRPSVVLDSAVIHMHLLVASSAWRWSHCLSFPTKRTCFNIMNIGFRGWDERWRIYSGIEILGMSLHKQMFVR